jgi:L-cysteine:1D-myo-inositol 2-amino-2-deoxy-alpha-D-glucopyranoside ligase
LKLYNTLTRRIEQFQTRGKNVTVYVCGITPYDTTHIGHAFTYAVYDNLIRYLRLRELNVRYAQNVTDIDDDILRRAAVVGEDWRELGNTWTLHYIADMQSLNILPPDEFPRATETIPAIIDSVQQLVDQGVAYVAGSSVYYSVNSWPGFGKLSQIPRADMLAIANERGNHPEDPSKRDPLDFVLWQAQAPGEPAWDSPWGRGRPGWHIECSTMAREYLGDMIDMHGGGADLCFPHHECEIAQVEPLDEDKPFARFWMHSAMVSYKGDKMSKSLGNLVMVSDLLGLYHPDAVRLLLASNHYRKPWEYKEDQLKEAEKKVEVLNKALKLESGDRPVLESEPFWARFAHDMEEDLDTPQAIDVIMDLAAEIQEASLVNRDLKEAQDALRSMCGVLGLRLDKSDVDDDVTTGWGRYIEKFQ